jgi:hypothetical protein
MGHSEADWKGFDGDEADAVVIGFFGEFGEVVEEGLVGK